jgi:prevent-host-death family protein
MIQTLPITKAREELTSLVENAKKRLDEYVITVNGIPAAVIVSVAEYESWKETNEILADKKLMKAIKQGEEDIKAGRVYDWEDVKKELKLNVQDKTHQPS